MPVEFVDTNILVYAYDRTAESKFDRARELMEKLWDSGESVVSTQVLEEFYVTVTAKIPYRLRPAETRRIIADLGTWRVAVLNIRDILAGSEIAERYRLNFGMGSSWLRPIKKKLQPSGLRISATARSTARSQFTIRSCSNSMSQRVPHAWR